MRTRPVPASVRRLLVLRTGALGDMLLTAPALARLRAACSAVSLTLVGAPQAGGLLRQARLVDAVVPFDHPALAPLFLGPAGVQDAGAAHRITSVLDRPDAAIVWLRDADGSVGSALDALGIPVVIRAASLPPGARPDGTADSGEVPHVAQHLYRSLDSWLDPAGSRREPATDRSGTAQPATAQLPIPRLVPSASAQAWAAALWERMARAAAQPVVALHPGSGSRRKNWPAERFAATARDLAAAGVDVLLRAGPADREAAAAVSRLAGAPILPVPAASLDQVAAILARCRLYLGNDSGITHLAAFVGASVVAVFGPTAATVWHPLGPHSHIVRAADPALPWPTVEEVAAAVRRGL